MEYFKDNLRGISSMH